MNLRRLMALVMALALLFVAGCGGSTKDTKSPAQPQADTKSASKEPIVLLGFYDSKDPEGQKSRTAAEMAADEINKAGGALGRQIKVVFLDESDDPATGLKKADEAKPFAMFGFNYSSNALKYYPGLMKMKKPLIISGAGTPAITDAVSQDPQNNKYMFRIAFHARDTARTAYVLLQEILKAKTYLYVAQDNAFGKSLEPVLADLLKGDGINSVGSLYFKEGEKNFDSVIKTIQEKKPDAVLTYLQTSYKDFIITYTGQKVPAPMFEFASGTVEGESKVKTDFGDQLSKIDHVLLNLRQWNSPVTSKTKPFYAAFKAKTGEEPQGYFDARAADAVSMLADAIVQAGAVDADKVVATLEKRTYTGRAGNYEFDLSHQAKWGRKYMPSLIGQWQNGKIEVIWPEETKTGIYSPAEWWKK